MDKDVIARVKKGDKQAFEQLYNEYAEYAIRTAFAITKNSADASDAVQEAFIRVYRNIIFYDEERPFKPWFYKILVNECNRITKRKSKVIPIDQYLDDHYMGLHMDDYKFEEYEELYAAIQGLKEINRIPIILKYLNNFSEKEIAEIFDVNINTVKSRLFKGRERIKQALLKMKEGREKNGGKNL
ncbi:MAG: RNA polymerase sigma factor [Caldicoprobacter sp.]|uniref:RNA polymerase sigma factor n=1 Tax=Caldicoprobacter sp. TaxID=2004500 RepID=UPI001DBEFB32|nr:RNA polymerase subunit sigma-24 [Clostridia bacterium]